MAASDGRIYYADSMGGYHARVFDPERSLWEDLPLLDHSQSHYYLSETSDGAIWFGGAGEIFCLRGSEPSLYLPHQLSLSLMPLNLFESRDGRLWLIEQFGKVHVVDVTSRYWQTYPRLHYQCETPDGVRWFLRRDGAVISQDQKTGDWLGYDGGDGMIDQPTRLYLSREGTLLAFGGHSGDAAVAAFKDGRWHRRVFSSMVGPILKSAILEAEDGSMIVGANILPEVKPSRTGFLQFSLSDSGEVEVLRRYRPPEFPQWVQVLAQSQDGKLWHGDALIHTFDFENEAFGLVEDLPIRFTDDLVVDSDSNVWLAKGGFGVWRFDGITWQRFTTKEGLVDDMVSDLLPLADGSLLASSESGISRFDGVGWTTDAMPSSLAIMRRRGEMREAEDEAIWFNLSESDWQLRGRDSSGPHTAFCSVRYASDRTPPDTWLDYYEVTVSQKGNTHIRWGAQDGWNHTPNDQVEFSWRMNDEDWSAYNLQREKTFIDLPWGEHLLEVRARDRDFNVDATPAQVRFEVEPPVWMRWWFLILVVAVVALSILLVYVIIRGRMLRLEEERRLSHEREKHLEEVDLLKTGFVNNISHELNTPITSLMIPLERMTQREGDPQRKRRLSLLLRNAQRVKGLVQQLLLFRDVEQGNLSINHTQGDLAHFLATRIDLLQPIAETHEVELYLEGVSTGPSVFAPDELGKIVDNLVGNAIKYSNGSGSVRIIWEVQVDASDRCSLILCIEDQGVGIPEEHLPYIFDRFYRIPEDALIDGTGIGLNLTKQLIVLLGGSIDVESPIHDDVEYPGTRFRVTLPIGNSNSSMPVKSNSVDEVSEPRKC